MFYVLHSHFSTPFLIPDGSLLRSDARLCRLPCGKPAAYRAIMTWSEAAPQPFRLQPGNSPPEAQPPGREGSPASHRLTARKAAKPPMAPREMSGQSQHMNTAVCGDGGAARRLNIGIAGLAEQTNSAAKPTQDAAKPTQDAAKPTQDAPKPIQSTAKPGHGLAKLSQRVAMSAQGLAIGTHGVARLSHHGPELSQHGAMPSHHLASLARDLAKRSRMVAKPLRSLAIET